MPKRAVADAERAIEGLYTVREGDVAGWLRKYPYLVPLLIEGREQALRIFGPDTKFALELTIDPEIPNFRQLFAFIITDLDGEEAADRLEKFDHEWGLDAPFTAREKLVFDTSFR